MELEQRYLSKLKNLSIFKWCLIIIFLSGYVIFFTRIKEYKSKFDLSTTIIKGKVSFWKVDGYKLTIELVSKEKIIVNYYFKTEREKEKTIKNLKIKDVISVKGKIKKPNNNTIPNTFSYQKYLYNKRIYYVFEAVELKMKEKGKTIKNIIFSRIQKLDNHEYLLALILGDKSYLDIDLYQRNGVSHLFAVSGMHVNFLVDFFEKKLKIKRKSLIVLFLWFYAYIVSFAVGVVRVVIYKTLKIFASKKKYNNIKLLLMTGFIMILFNPFYVYDYGFLYSFLISFGIMLFQNNTDNFFVSLLKVSSISFLFSIPITASLNYSINLSTILNNIIVVPYVSFFLFPFSFITIIFPLFNYIYGMLITILEYTNNLFPELIVVIGKQSIFIWPFYYLFLILAKFKNIKLLYLNIILLLISKYKFNFIQDMQVYFLDVGQGDSILIIYPQNKKSILIDCGGTLFQNIDKWKQKTKPYDITKNMVQFIYSLGINHIDVFVASHGDYDHIGNYEKLNNKIKISKTIINKGNVNSLENKIILQDNIITNYHDSYFETFNPKISNNENDNSILCFLNFYNTKILFLGDISNKVEQTIKRKTDIIKIAHHGSKNSSDYNFLKRTNPTYAIISSGRNNIYNHPDEETLMKLNKLRIKTYNTQNDGTIKLLITKKGRTFFTYNP